MHLLYQSDDNLREEIAETTDSTIVSKSPLTILLSIYYRKTGRIFKKELQEH